jgi:hypothetical protein
MSSCDGESDLEHRRGRPSLEEVIDGGKLEGKGNSSGGADERSQVGFYELERDSGGRRSSR